MDEFGDTGYAAVTEVADECTHEDLESYDSFTVCTACGETQEIIQYGPEWKYYGPRDNKHARDPSRCHFNSGPKASRSIRALLEKYPEAIVAATDRKYQRVVGPKTVVRGDRRKGIVAVCLWKVHQEIGDFRELGEFGRELEVERKHLSKGLTEYNEAHPYERTEFITPQRLLPRILERTHLTKQLLAPVEELYARTANSSRTLARSNPQSIAAAIPWLFLCLNPAVKRRYGLNKRKYAQRAGLSEITITKLAKEAARGLNCPRGLKI